MMLAIRRVEVTDDDTGKKSKKWCLTNRADTGYGDVIRAVDMTGYSSTPRSGPHPALRHYDTKAEAVRVAEQLGRALAERHGGAYDIVS